MFDKNKIIALAERIFMQDLRDPEASKVNTDDLAQASLYAAHVFYDTADSYVTGGAVAKHIASMRIEDRAVGLAPSKTDADGVHTFNLFSLDEFMKGAPVKPKNADDMSEMYRRFGEALSAALNVAEKK